MEILQLLESRTDPFTWHIHLKMIHLKWVGQVRALGDNRASPCSGFYLHHHGGIPVLLWQGHIISRWQESGSTQGSSSVPPPTSPEPVLLWCPVKVQGSLSQELQPVMGRPTILLLSCSHIPGLAYLRLQLQGQLHCIVQATYRAVL